MRIDARKQFDVIAQGTDEQIAVLVDITAPLLETADAVTRPPHTLQVVLDRSGSMAGERLEVAKAALADVIDQLRPDDNFGLVAFDNEVRVVVPAGPLTDKQAAKAAIMTLTPGGSTNLSAGYARGLQEAARVAGPAGATVLLVSDGHANAGISDAGILGGRAGEAFHTGVTTSALGIGEGYNEHLLAALSRGGRGNDGMALEPDGAAHFITEQVDGLLTQAAQSVTLMLRTGPAVRRIEFANDLHITPTPDGPVLELGSLYSQETRTLALVFDVPAVSALGPLGLATLELSWADMPALKPHTTQCSIGVEVVTPAAAAGRRHDATVETELTFQYAQQAKQRAARALSGGHHKKGIGELRQARSDILAAAVTAPPEAVAGLAEEVAVLTALIHQATSGQYNRASKSALKDAGDKGRHRGRQYSEATRLDYRSRTDQDTSYRRTWIDLADSIRILSPDPQDREPIAEAITALLDGQPDFNATRFRCHALSTSENKHTHGHEAVEHLS